MAILGKQSGDANISRVNSILSKGGLTPQEEVAETPEEETQQEPEAVEAPQEEVTAEQEVQEPVETEETTEDEITNEEPVEPEAPEEPETTPVSYDNESVLNYLKENFGFEGELTEEAFKPKVVEPELPENLRILKEWSEKTGLDISQWPDYNKDYSKMSDLDVAREILVGRYPDFTEEELQSELEEFIPDEFDEPKDKLKKSKNLKKFAADGRKELEAKKVELKPASLSPDQVEKLEFADSIQKQIDESAKVQEQYKQTINQRSLNFKGLDVQLSEDMKFTHKLDEKGKKDLAKFVMNPKGWYNEDGTPNHDNIIQDAVKLRDFDILLKKAYEQGLNDQKAGKLTEPRTPQAQEVPQNSAPTSSKSNVHSVIQNLKGNRTGGRLRFRNK